MYNSCIYEHQKGEAFPRLKPHESGHLVYVCVHVSCSVSFFPFFFSFTLYFNPFNLYSPFFSPLPVHTCVSSDQTEFRRGGGANQ